MKKISYKAQMSCHTIGSFNVSTSQREDQKGNKTKMENNKNNVNKENEAIPEQKISVLDLGVGTTEMAKIDPAVVVIMDVKEEGVGAGGKLKKIVCAVKHPNKDEPINVSAIKYENSNKLTQAGLWIKLDEEGMIQKGSALSVLLKFLDVSFPRDLVGKKINTVLDDKGYLTLKCY